MTHRLIAVLLTASLAVAGQAVSRCPQGRSAMIQAVTCCQHDGVTRPCCGDRSQRSSVNAAGLVADRRVRDTTDNAAGPSMRFAVVWNRPIFQQRQPIQSTAMTPGTLLRQRTSL